MPTIKVVPAGPDGQPGEIMRPSKKQVTAKTQAWSSDRPEPALVDLKEALVLHQAVSGVGKLLSSLWVSVLIFFALQLEVPDTTGNSLHAWFLSTERMDVEVNGKHLTSWADAITMQEARQYAAAYTEHLVQSSAAAFRDQPSMVQATQHIMLEFARVGCVVQDSVYAALPSPWRQYNRIPRSVLFMRRGNDDRNYVVCPVFEVKSNGTRQTLLDNMHLCLGLPSSADNLDADGEANRNGTVVGHFLLTSEVLCWFEYGWRDDGGAGTPSYFTTELAVRNMPASATHAYRYSQFIACPRAYMYAMPEPKRQPYRLVVATALLFILLITALACMVQKLSTYKRCVAARLGRLHAFTSAWFLYEVALYLCTAIFGLQLIAFNMALYTSSFYQQVIRQELPLFDNDGKLTEHADCYWFLSNSFATWSRLMLLPCAGWGLLLLKHLYMHPGLSLFRTVMYCAGQPLKDVTVVLTYLVVIIALPVYLLFMQNAPTMDFSSVGDSILSILLLTLGYYDYNSFASRPLFTLGNVTWLAVLAFVAIVVFLVIIGQNVVLAIVASAYDEAKEARTAEMEGSAVRSPSSYSFLSFLLLYIAFRAKVLGMRLKLKGGLAWRSSEQVYNAIHADPRSCAAFKQMSLSLLPEMETLFAFFQGPLQGDLRMVLGPMGKADAELWSMHFPRLTYSLLPVTTTPLSLGSLLEHIASSPLVQLHAWPLRRRAYIWRVGTATEGGVQRLAEGLQACYSRPQYVPVQMEAACKTVPLYLTTVWARDAHGDDHAASAAGGGGCGGHTHMDGAAGSASGLDVTADVNSVVQSRNAAAVRRLIGAGETLFGIATQRRAQMQYMVLAVNSLCEELASVKEEQKVAMEEHAAAKEALLAEMMGMREEMRQVVQAMGGAHGPWQGLGAMGVAGQRLPPGVAP